MYCHRPSRTVFLANPRTASGSTSFALLAAGWDRFKPDGIWNPHLGLPDGWRGRHPEWRVLCTVRHPADTVVSWTFHRYAEPPPLDPGLLADRLDRLRPHAQTRLFPHALVAHDLLRFETLEADVARLLAVTLPDHRPHRSAGRRPGHASYFSPSTRRLVEARYAEEFETLGYRW